MTQTKRQPEKSPAVLMRELRLKALTTPPAEWGHVATDEFRRVCAVVMDWPNEARTVTVVARASGEASLCTTGVFGVSSGIGDATVRKHAKDCVKAAEKLFEDGRPTKKYPWPALGRIRFYLVGYDGVRVIEEDLKSRTGGGGTSIRTCSPPAACSPESCSR